MRARNGMHPLSAVGSLLVGAFLMLGAYGHVAAVLPSLGGATGGASDLVLLLPGSILAANGLFSILLVKALWDGRRWALDAALGANALVLGYLLYLLWRDVPDHPVAAFTGIVACQLVVLVATRAGLVWAVGMAAAGPRGGDGSRR